MRNLTLALVTAIALTALIACPPKGTPQPSPPGDPVGGYEPPPPIDAGPEAAADAEAASEPGAEGASCTTAGDCASGVCEGEGCGDGQGVCAPAQRGCTKDLRPYCGCDGVTFRASGTCPGQRYAHTGECP